MDGVFRSDGVIRRGLPAVMVLVLLGTAPCAALAAPQTGVGGAAQAGTSVPAAPAPKTDEARFPPLVIAAWTYSSIGRNGVTASINFAHGRTVRAGVLWRGLQATTTIASRGFEVGGGYGKYIFSSLPGGYEFRGLVGRRWEESETLSPARTYVGGEATLMFVWFRFSGGLVVPIDAGRPHQPVLTGSIGWMIPLTPLWNKELRTMK